MEEIKLKSVDDYELCVHIFDTKIPKAVIQVIHGMEEHQERYESFIKFLNKNGYACVSSDMRGHGKTAKDLGYFADKKGYELLIQDQKTITNFIQNRHPNLPIYIFAHSMGTIITRVLLQSDSKKYKKVVLSGYPNYQSGAKFGILFAGVTKTFKGAKHKSKFIQNLAVGAFNKKIDNPKTDVDWVCKNQDTVKSYIDDPLCGIGFTCSAFSDLFHLVKFMHQPKLYKDVNSEIKLLLLRGKEDPCTGGEKGSADSVNVLKKAGFKNIEKIDYDEMRHEILNETNKEKVYEDVINFFNK